MSEWNLETWRLLTSATLLMALLGWETIRPYYPFFVQSRWRRCLHAGRNLFLGAINAALNLGVCAGIWWVIGQWAEGNGWGILYGMGFSGWGRVLAACLLLDCWMYFWHRLNHQSQFLWRFHAVHHSDQTMDVTTASRFHIGELLLSCLFRIPVVVAFGITVFELALFEGALFLMTLFHHANIGVSPNGDRVLRTVVVTPLMHKVHHSRVQAEADSNYAAFSSIWDRLFSTYRTPSNPERLRLGLPNRQGENAETLSALLWLPFRGWSADPSGPPTKRKTDSTPFTD